MEWNPLALDPQSPVRVSVQAGQRASLAWLDERGKPLLDTAARSAIALPASRSWNPSGVVVALPERGEGGLLQSVTLEASRALPGKPICARLSSGLPADRRAGGPFAG
ncbi:MAG: hypothetical protein IT210_19320 [Armatimonadetes bacterium]|nr:hypothetical protein [Armatimonadota bacterium]